ncbi:peroxisomal coenzyme A diphosphatase NUDT7 [Dunckerocampus dactyliophorus]|uniref:peroxisomal coenzyme A diphosphatase NUDT7 n=1 Tax=Dunckerocampus dactyliophorus TaxID=161453 RepID=UPI0024073ACC|nr:peroxisomal coenzyme A diphosphatase NUDT7 [Dunckerocampus dactyliophorus]
MAIKMETIAVFEQFDVRKVKLMTLPALNKASVLVPLFVRSGKLYTLMTQRSKQLRTSGGEVCFPGGKKDPCDKDEVDTALREAQEEIGVHPGDVHVICTLHPIISKNNLLVTPVVGFIEESFRPSPNPAEVSAAFTVPLDVFAFNKDHFDGLAAAQAAVPSLSFDYVDPDTGAKYHIWGLTAMIAFIVATIAHKTKPEFDMGFNAEELQGMLRRHLHKRLSKL